MAEPKTKGVEAPDAQIERPEPIEVKDVTIEKVSIYTADGATNGTSVTIGLNLSKKVKTFDKKGDEVETDFITMKLGKVVDQVTKFIPELQLASALALGAVINPQIVALCLTNAKIEILENFKFAEEQREGMNETYGKNTWVKDITKCTPNINPLFMPTLGNLINTAPAIKLATAAAAMPNVVASNPWGI